MTHWNLGITWVMLKCILKWLLCPSLRINLFNLALHGTHILPLNLKTLSDHIINFLTCSISSNPTVFYRLGSNHWFSFIKLRKSLDIVKLLYIMKFTPNSTCNFKSLNFSTNSSSLVIMRETYIIFLLKASTTTFVFSKWYSNSKS